MPHQRELRRDGVRPAGQEDLVAGRERPGRRVDAADQEPQPVLPGKGAQPLPAGGQEHAPAQRRQHRGRVGQRRRVPPVIAVLRGPAGPGQAQQGEIRPRARVGRVGADRLGERVGGVDDGGHALGRGPPGQAVGAAEAAHPHLARGERRVADPARQRRDHPQARPASQVSGQRPPLGSSAQHEHRGARRPLSPRRLGRAGPGRPPLFHRAATVRTWPRRPAGGAGRCP